MPGAAQATHGSGSLADRLCLLVRLTLVPFLVRHALQRNRVTILLYHRPAAEAFARHVRALRRAYTLISLETLVAALERGMVRDLPPRSLVVTFDDGHRSNHGLIDTVRELPAPPTVFLCSGIVATDEPYWFDVAPEPEALKRLPDAERLQRLGAEPAARPGSQAALSAREIEELKPYVDFQSHTVSHPILTRCSDEKARREVVESRADLERRYGLRVYALAYPNGDYSEREIRLARDAGYRCCVTVDFGFNSQATDPFRLRRIAINDEHDGVSVVMVKACGLWGWARAVIRR